jgi:hypothetical protein
VFSLSAIKAYLSPCYRNKKAFPLAEKGLKILLYDLLHDPFLFQSHRIKLKGLNLIVLITTPPLFCQAKKSKRLPFKNNN